MGITFCIALTGNYIVSSVNVKDMLYTTLPDPHKGDKQVEMTWITRLELHCDAGTSGVPILLRLVTLTLGDRTQDT